ncbi:hypothetical protein [Nocardia sp. NPDC057440]|uniref:hypothetical protein n=1 Tax=Nocardia sp. NPDC057440 TaxID=3346134 RepID=UPI00366B5130
MAKHIAGKTFSTPEEAGVTPPTAEEIAAANAAFAAFDAQRAAVPESERLHLSERFIDDTSGTEFDTRNNT